jgi:hypothetical protein
LFKIGSGPVELFIESAAAAEADAVETLKVAAERTGFESGLAAIDVDSTSCGLKSFTA